MRAYPRRDDGQIVVAHEHAVRLPEKKRGRFLRIPAVVLKSIGFVAEIYGSDLSSDESDLVGTAFVVSLPAKTLNNFRHYYFVTAKHVLKGKKLVEGGLLPPVRTNLNAFRCGRGTGRRHRLCRQAANPARCGSCGNVSSRRRAGGLCNAAARDCPPPAAGLSRAV